MLGCGTGLLVVTLFLPGSPFGGALSFSRRRVLRPPRSVRFCHGTLPFLSCLRLRPARVGPRCRLPLLRRPLPLAFHPPSGDGPTAKGAFLAGFDGNPPSPGPRLGNSVRWRGADQGILRACIEKAARPPGADRGFPSKPARKSVSNAASELEGPSPSHRRTDRRLFAPFRSACSLSTDGGALRSRLAEGAGEGSRARDSVGSPSLADSVCLRMLALIDRRRAQRV